MASLIPKVNATAGSATAPTAAALATGELAENKFTGRLYVKTEAANVVDPARVTLTGDVTGSTAAATSEAQGGTIACTLATVGVGKGGTGLTATPANGQIPIGNGTGFTLANLTAGTNVSITNTAGAITINSSASGGGGGGGIKIFDTPGANQSWTVPTGVTSVKITVIGAGGGGTNGGASSCSVGGTTVTAGGGLAGGTGGSVAAVAGVGLGAGTGGAGGPGYVQGQNGSGSSGGYGGGGGGYGNYGGCPTVEAYVPGGCGIGGGGGGWAFVNVSFPGPGAGYGGNGQMPNQFGGGGLNYGGGGGYATYTIAVVSGTTYTNAITVGAAGSGASRGAVIIEW